MASKYEFYYDETEHSRKIKYNTVSAANYYDNFFTMIVVCNGIITFFSTNISTITIYDFLFAGQQFRHHGYIVNIC